MQRGILSHKNIIYFPKTYLVGGGGWGDRHVAPHKSATARMCTANFQILGQLIFNLFKKKKTAAFRFVKENFRQLL